MAGRDLALILLALTALITDLRQRRIPNGLTVPAAVMGLALNLVYLGPAAGLDTSLWGLAAGLALPLPFFVLGGMGGGDVKLFAALGAWTGPWRIFSIFIYAALAGGLISFILLLVRGRPVNLRRVAEDLALLFLTRAKVEGRGDRETLPYSLPIAVGVFWAILFGDLR